MNGEARVPTGRLSRGSWTDRTRHVDVGGTRNSLGHQRVSVQQNDGCLRQSAEEQRATDGRRESQGHLGRATEYLGEESADIAPVC